jgi:hypothetical protein
LHGGVIALSKSTWGGLKVSITLPYNAKDVDCG